MIVPSPAHGSRAGKSYNDAWLDLLFRGGMTVDPLRLEVKLDGEGVRLETVRLNDLFNLLKKLQEAIGATATGRESPDDESGFSISLVGVSPGSACLTVSLPESVETAVRKLIAAIHNRNPAVLPLPARRALAE